MSCCMYYAYFSSVGVEFWVLVEEAVDVRVVVQTGALKRIVIVAQTGGSHGRAVDDGRNG